MDVVNHLLMSYGYWGMFLAALLAGSFFPFSSEAVMLGLLALGLNPMPLLIYGTAGNVCGGMFNYWVGHLGRLDWIERHLHVKQKDLQRAERIMAGHGAWIGFFGFLPIIGSAITIMLGYMRANLLISFLSITIGKMARYAVMLYGAASFM